MLGARETDSTQDGAACTFEWAGLFCRRSSHALSGAAAADWLDLSTCVPSGGKACWARAGETVATKRASATGRKSILAARLGQRGRTCKLWVISKTAERILKTTKPTTIAMSTMMTGGIKAEITFTVRSSSRS